MISSSLTEALNNTIIVAKRSQLEGRCLYINGELGDGWLAFTLVGASAKSEYGYMVTGPCTATVQDITNGTKGGLVSIRMDVGPEGVSSIGNDLNPSEDQGETIESAIEHLLYLSGTAIVEQVFNASFIT